MLFVAVGATGLLVHLAVLGLLLKGAGVPFWIAQSAAALVAMVSNYTINNLFTFRDKRLKGARYFSGLAKFCVACGVGAVVNVAVATTVFEVGVPWLASGLIGAVIGAVWNFAITSIFVWNERY